MRKIRVNSEDVMNIIGTAAAVAYFGQGAYRLARRAVNEHKLKKRYKDQFDRFDESWEETTFVEG